MLCLDVLTACTLPRTALVRLYHTSVTASLVTFTYLCSSASQNAFQAVAAFAVTKCVTRTVRPAGLFYSTCVWFQGKQIQILCRVSASVSLHSGNSAGHSQKSYFLLCKCSTSHDQRAVFLPVSWRFPSEFFLFAKADFPWDLQKAPGFHDSHSSFCPGVKMNFHSFHGNKQLMWIERSLQSGI